MKTSLLFLLPIIVLFSCESSNTTTTQDQSPIEAPITETPNSDFEKDSITFNVLLDYTSNPPQIISDTLINNSECETKFILEVWNHEFGKSAYRVAKERLNKGLERHMGSILVIIYLPEKKEIGITGSDDLLEWSNAYTKERVKNALSLSSNSQEKVNIFNKILSDFSCSTE